MSKRTVLKNCRLYNKNEDKRYSIIIEKGKIEDVSQNSISDAENIVDIEGRLVCPGLIDIHIHGAGGVDSLAAHRPEDVLKMSKTLGRLGTTSYLPTLVPVPGKLEKAIEAIEKVKYQEAASGAEILGVHLEGPFINIDKKGGLFPEGIYRPTPEKIDKLFEVGRGLTRMMTVAPEIDQDYNVTKRLLKENAVPSLGHTLATYEQTLEAFDAGIQHITHLFNAMPSIHHRAAGPLVAIFENDAVTVQLISDGVHVNPEVIEWVYDQIGGERCVCISDGILSMGLPDGEYDYHGRPFESKNGTARYLDGTLIGTAVSLADIVFRFKEYTGCDLETAVNTATINAAKVLGIDDQKGSLETGKDADIVVFDEDQSVWGTWVNGNHVYRND